MNYEDCLQDLHLLAQHSSKGREAAHLIVAKIFKNVRMAGGCCMRSAPVARIPLSPGVASPSSVFPLALRSAGALCLDKARQLDTVLRSFSVSWERVETLLTAQ